MISNNKIKIIIFLFLYFDVIYSKRIQRDGEEKDLDGNAVAENNEDFKEDGSAVTPAPLMPKPLPLNLIQDIANEGGYPTIQYYINSSSYDLLIENRVRAVMDRIEQASCVRFESIPSESSRDRTKMLISISNPSQIRQCLHVPYQNSRLRYTHIPFGYDCLKERDILHTLMHAIGFNDEVTHPERNKYIRVMWNNILPQYARLFRINNNDFYKDNPVEYDPRSIMQFHDRQYSRNGRPTIVPVVAGMSIEPSDDLSALDKMKLRMVFGHACNLKKLSEVMVSCKMAMKDEKPGDGEKSEEDERPKSAGTVEDVGDEGGVVVLSGIDE